MGSTGLIVPFGRYVLKERLAQGGMGEVFRAVAVGEHGFEKPVVVKRVLPAHAGRDDLADLFVAEAKLMTKLAHPNIVGVLDFGRGEHRDYYLVLELVEGADLGRLIRAYAARGEAFPVPLALFVASQMLRGLHHAHTRSAGEGAVIVHRDVSPSNVLCSTEGEVKVADFGVALVTRAARGGGGGDGGGAAGKPGYMAPEQFDGGLVDPRADVFSAGVVLFQMLTGDLPFRGETPEAQQAAARRGEREAARAVRPDLSEAIDAILTQALAAGPDARFQDAKAMAQAIEGLRESGQRIASGDDLAEAVREAQRALPPPGRKVIALSSVPAEGAPDSIEGPSELARSAAPGGVGAFTLRFPVRADATTRQADASETAIRGPDRWSTPEPRTERIAPGELPPASGAMAPSVTVPELPPSGRVPLGALEAVEQDAEDAPPIESPRRRALRLGAIGAVLAAALLGVVALATRAAPGNPPHLASPAPPPPPSPSPRPSAEAPAPATAAIPAPPPPPAPAPAPRPSGRAVPLRVGASSAPAAITANAMGAATASSAPADDCTGDVRIKSEGAWVVSGGPRTEESPTVTRWRCGHYQLTARSRLDQQVKSASVTVGAGQTAVVDLR